MLRWPGSVNLPEERWTRKLISEMMQIYTNAAHCQWFWHMYDVSIKLLVQSMKYC